MASEIRVDKINSLSGVGTVTLSPTGVDIAGITTVATFKVGTGVTASSDGDIFATGVCTATTFSGSGASLTNLPSAQLTGALPALDGSNLTGISGVSVANQSDNRLITATGTTDALNGESGLTYSSNILDVTNAVRLPDDGTVHFGASDTSYVRGKDSTDGYLKLGTAGLERVRIDSSGRAIIGGTTPLDTTAGALTIDCGTSGGRIALRGTTTNASSGIGEMFAHWDTNKVAGFQMRSGTDTSNKDDGTIEFYTANGSGVVEQLSIAAAGDVTVKTGNLIIGTSGKGIDFSATGNGSGTMTSELLSDYEEGTFNPILQNGNNGYRFQYGMYRKVGNAVHFTAFIETSATPPSSNIAIGGLPYTSANNSNANAYVFPMLTNRTSFGTNGGLYARFYMWPNTTYAQLYYPVNSSSSNFETVNADQMNAANASNVWMSGTYFTE